MKFLIKILYKLFSFSMSKNEKNDTKEISNMCGEVKHNDLELTNISTLTESLSQSIRRKS